MPNIPRVYRYIPGIDERSTLMLTSPDPSVGSGIEAIDQIEHWLQALPARHAKVCREIYLNHKSQGEVAENYGCAKSRVSHLHTEALDFLRQFSAVRAAAMEIGLDVARN